RDPIVYLVEPEINPGYEWVFTESGVRAVEKLDGMNVRIQTRKGRLIKIQNRKNVIDPLQVVRGRNYIIEAVFNAIDKNYVKENGVQDGEVVGPRVQSNPYQLKKHLWYPFTKSYESLSYNSFYDYDRTFSNWSDWFHNWLMSRFWAKRQEFGTASIKSKNKVLAEGLVFYRHSHEEHKKHKKMCWRGKLRRDMFSWFFKDKGIRIEEKIS
ncbi:MAG: RNA ligase family protein, partial [Petrotogales bacterium]